jgi:O-antigen/teichoic acid export membrane protein
VVKEKVIGLLALSPLKLNILATYVGRYWSNFLSFALIPVYIHYLGIESYALIGAFTSIMSFISLLDLGMSATLRREVAFRSAKLAEYQTIPDLLRTVEIIYWGIGLAILILTLPLAELISTQWLRADRLDISTIKVATSILCVNFAIQWTKAPYLGVLMSLEKQIESNFVEASSNTLRLLGSVAVIAWISPTIIAFLLWQTATYIIQIALYVWLTWKIIPKSPVRPSFQSSILHQTWKYASVVGATTLVNLLLTQVDKILLSKLLPLEQFGYYMLANSMAQFCTVLFYPLVVSITPRLNLLVAEDNEQQLASIFHKSSLIISATVTPVAGCLIFFAPLILDLWTHSPKIVGNTSIPLSFLTIGMLTNSMMHLPYQLQLAIGKPRIMLITNICLVSIVIPSMLIFIPTYAAVGASVIWAMLNTFYYLIVSRITHLYVLKKEYSRWLVDDTLVPMLICSIVYILAWYVSQIYAVKIVSIASLIVALITSYGGEFLWYRNREMMRAK